MLPHAPPRGPNNGHTKPQGRVSNKKKERKEKGTDWASANAARYVSFSQPLPYSAPCCVYTTPHPARTISRGRLRVVAVVVPLPPCGVHHRRLRRQGQKVRGRSGRATTRLYWSRLRSSHLIRRPSMFSLSHASDSVWKGCAGRPKYPPLLKIKSSSKPTIDSLHDREHK
jgi:hypothetical protein